MSGLRIIVPGLTLPVDAPRLVQVDPIETDGSLLLVEPMPLDESKQWAAGVPASGSLLRNLLADKALAVYGSGVEADVSPSIVYANLDNVRGKVERSAKGGLHVILSQDDARVADTNDPYLGMLHTAKFREWMYLHPDHDLYVSMWVWLTRIQRLGTVAGTYTGNSANYLYVLRAGSSNQRIRFGGSNPVGNDLGGRNDVAAAVGPKLLNSASAAWGTNPASASATNDYGVTLGAYPGSQGTLISAPSTAQARWPSYVVYRWYVEDLTVSGRTYAQVDALDLALYTKEVLTAGGRYYGDTVPTDPATIP